MLRGHLSPSREKQPSRQDPPLIPRTDPRFANALTAADYSISFLLTNGSSSASSSIFALTPSCLEMFSHRASLLCLQQTIVTDMKLNVVMLPKVCEWYQTDFGEDGKALLKLCCKILEGTRVGEELVNLIHFNVSLPALKYLKFNYDSNPTLLLVKK